MRRSLEGIWTICALFLWFDFGYTVQQTLRNPCHPRCLTSLDIGTLWASTNARYYWQCESADDNLWNIRLKECSFGTLFSYEYQACVVEDFFRDDINQCRELPPQDWIGECPEPSCETNEEIHTLWSTPDPRYFLQCRPEPGGSWVIQQMPCALPTLFHFGQQTCVHPNKWEACDGAATTTPVTTDQPPSDITPVTTPVTTVSPPITADTTPVTTPVTTVSPPITADTTPVTTPVTTVSPPITADTTPVTTPVTTVSPPITADTTPVTTPVTTVSPPITADTTPVTTPVTTVSPPITADTTPVTTPETTPQHTELTPPSIPILDGFCIEPKCETNEDINTLWPHRLAEFFYQCRPAFGGGWTPQLMPCAPGTMFSFAVQVCVWPNQWEDPCDTSDATPEDPTSPTPDPEGTTPSPDPSPTPDPEGTTPSPDPSPTPDPEGTTPSPDPSPTPDPEGTTPSPDPSPTPDPEGTTPSPDTTPTPDGPLEPDCLVPNCVYLQNSEVLWPTREPRLFYRCIFLLDTVWIPFQDSCPVGKYFSFEYQSCVDPELWTDVCATIPEDITTTQMTTISTPEDDEDEGFPLPVICGSPRCNTIQERSILWPSTVANTFYECVWVERWFQFIPLPKRCPNFLLFDFVKQDCVDPKDWTDICPIYPTLPPNCPECCPTCPPVTDTTTVIPDDPSAPEDWPLPVICGNPRCETPVEQNFLWPALDPQGFYICLDFGSGWIQATLVFCENEMFFQTKEQKCVPQEEYDYGFCPVFPELPPVPTASPLNCQDNFDPIDLYPIVCDQPRCATNSQLSIRWPAADKGAYYSCQSVGVQVLEKCDPGLKFDFFRQCCTMEQSEVEVCPMYPVQTPENPLVCSNDFNPSDLLPVECDIPRCTTSSETAAYWPSQQSTKYYKCSLNATTGMHFAEYQDCSEGEQFDYFRQCCSTTPIFSPTDVCALLPETSTDPAAVPEVPTDVGCDQPRCDSQIEQIYLWPSVDPNLFYSCELSEDGLMKPQQYSCPPGKWFIMALQSCGDTWLHQNVCEKEEPQSPIITPPSGLN
ncbi:uncharacterized protein LOC131425816 [Malaya genurostris]|uniref:uncharacterized protein LOC131425816 n=1 Tax=Malaya genurostris TaxID=325434 RepID=UPI0026F3CFBD|nr:uncharacterized protein LOC131425816 [Malaya genurostris]